MKQKTEIGWVFIFLCTLYFFGCVGGGLEQAKVKFDAQNYADAIPLFKEFLIENPNSVEARSRLGFAYLKTGRLDEAIAEFKTALKTEAGEPYSVLYLGLAYLNKGEIGKTIKTWQRYRNKKQPAVESEIKRQITLLQIAESQRLAKRALAEEKKLMPIEPKENTIAVSYFKDLSPDQSLGPFQKGLAAIVTTDLAKIKSLKVVERLRVQALLEEMALGQTGIIDERTAPRMGRLLGAKTFVVGSIRKGSLEVVTNVSGFSGAIRAALNDFWQIPCSCIKTVEKALNLALTTEDKDFVCAAHTKSLKAFVYYGKALMAQDAGNWKEAKDLFMKALKEDPLFELARKGAEGCPGAASPTPAALSSMAASQLASNANAALDAAQADTGSPTSSKTTTSSSTSGDIGH